MSKRIGSIVNLMVVFAMLVALFTASPVTARQQSLSNDRVYTTSDGSSANSTKTSHRLIVELQSAPLIVWAQSQSSVLRADGKIDASHPTAQAYVAQLQSEQAAFIANMQSALPGAQVDYYLNEFNAPVELTYQVVFNGVVVNPGTVDAKVAMRTLMALPDVKMVYRDYAHQPDLYASIPLINAPVLYANPEIGGLENAGAGIKFASMDGGIHHEAAMFDGTGFSYPPDFPPNGLGLTENNNGKIVASRAYFRAWDPPSPGDENPWPGTQGTSHGVHTASTAAGNEVVAEYGGITMTLAGVAPAAWVMSYRVFYNSVTNDGSFYTAEGIAALEDIAMDGADVLNNSWGGGPGSAGGEFDPLDQALINTAAAGVFVSMSNGNAGPGYGTSDHPSDDYINVASSTTDGTFASGRVSVIAPEPISDTLQLLPFGVAEFGASLPVGSTFTESLMTAYSVDPANELGCNPWVGTPFSGAVLIRRGTCNFSQKVYFAQQAGADFVIIYNHLGDSIQDMGAGLYADQVAISSIFVGLSTGLGMRDWYEAHGPASVIEVDTVAYQSGNDPDILAATSSRGPGVGNTLKPDITAPGVNIMAQGYASGVSGEDRHLGYGQASGTSMASPHITGSAALLRQVHPSWSNADIKSALMSTSKYVGIWNHDGTHAQPLDMGAGRVDLTNAADPGVILDPPSLSYGVMVTGTTQIISVTVTSVATTTQTYTLGTQLIEGTDFITITISDLPGFSVLPASLVLDPGESAVFTVAFSSTQGLIGDNQGHIYLESADYFVHMPAWARVTPEPTGKVLVIDNDFSYLLSLPDYQSYYTNALDNMGISYDVWEAEWYFGNPTTIPSAAELAAYDAVIYFTGDNHFNNGFFTVSTPLTGLDMNRLTEYANNGGVIFAMGQDLAAVLASDEYNNGTFFYNSVLGGNWLQDSLTDNDLPSAPVQASPDGPAALQGIQVDLRGSDRFRVEMVGANEVPPVASPNIGEALFGYDLVNQVLYYDVTIHANSPMTVTASHIHDGAAGVNGPVIQTLFTGPQYVTDTLTYNGFFVYTDTAKLLSDGLYINVHTTDYPAGELRAQVHTAVFGDGAGNQYYIDEIETLPWVEPDGGAGKGYPYMPLFRYPGPFNVENGTVAISHRAQPSLEVPGIDYNGRSIYTTFGLEGVNNSGSGISREDLISAFMDWAWDEPTVTISNTTPENGSHLYILLAEVPGAPGVQYRWDYGDGSAYSPWYTARGTQHVFPACGEYTVRVEMINIWGNHAIGETTIDVTDCPDQGGVTLSPLSASQTAHPGQMVTYALTVTNTGTVDDIFDITVNGNAWNTVTPASVGPLVVGVSTTVYVTVTIPGDAHQGDYDVAQIMVTSRVDNRRYAIATLTTYSTDKVIYLPLVNKQQP
jgi:subtilisin family serine protease